MSCKTWHAIVSIPNVLAYPHYEMRRKKYIRIRVCNFYSKIFSGKYSRNYYLKTHDSCNQEFLSLRTWKTNNYKDKYHHI
jgi:hypothetical protein